MSTKRQSHAGLTCTCTRRCEWCFSRWPVHQLLADVTAPAANSRKASCDTRHHANTAAQHTRKQLHRLCTRDSTLRASSASTDLHPSHRQSSRWQIARRKQSGWLAIADLTPGRGCTSESSSHKGRFTLPFFDVQMRASLLFPLMLLAKLDVFVQLVGHQPPFAQLQHDKHKHATGANHDASEANLAHLIHLRAPGTPDGRSTFTCAHSICGESHPSAPVLTINGPVHRLHLKSSA